MIDASNLRMGGGRTHLYSLLGSADPTAYGVQQVTVCGSRDTLEGLPERGWLARHWAPEMELSLFRRVHWQRFALTRLAIDGYDLLFSPGGSYPGKFVPFVTMSQNMLPFMESERKRYGWTRTRLKFELLKRMQLSTFRRASGVIFLSAFAKNVILGLLGEPKTFRIIPHGIGSEFVQEVKPQKSISEYSRDRPLRVLYVSTVDLYKHQDSLVEAVCILRKRGFPLSLSLVGPALGSAARKLEAKLDSVKDRTYFEYDGSVTHSELPHIYKGADVFAFASSCENLPIILLEAMASGLPIASSARGPMQEILGDDAVFFDPENVPTIVTALERLVLNPELRAHLAHQASQRARAYTWKRSANDTFTFLVEVARTAKRRQ